MQDLKATKEFKGPQVLGALREREAPLVYQASQGSAGLLGPGVLRGWMVKQACRGNRAARG